MVYSVYKVTNLENGKLYIGYTSKPVLERWKAHVYESRYGRKRRALTRAISKYGEKSFSVEPIYQSLDQEDALEKEVYFISEFETLTSQGGYNLTTGGTSGQHSEETKKKIGDLFRGEKGSWYGKVGPNKGRKFSEESIRKSALARRGLKRSEEEKKKTRDSHRKHNELNQPENLRMIESFRRDERLGWHKIAKRINELGVPTARGGLWTNATIKRVYKSACLDGLADPSLIVLDRSDEMLKCPHCGAEGKVQGMNRRHMDNCKQKV